MTLVINKKGNQMKNFNRIQRLFINKSKTDLKFQALCCFSSLGEFVNGGGAELMAKKGFDAYHRTARGFWKLYKA